jgi:hypothetical protein
MQTAAIEHDPGIKKFLIELSHFLDQLLTGHLASFGLFGCFH